MKTKICEHCKKEFIPKSWKQSLCEDCLSLEIDFICPGCGKKFILTRARKIKYLRGLLKEPIYCSVKCSTGGYKYCDVCGEDTYHMNWIRCMKHNNYSADKEVQNKIKQTNLQNLGVEWPTQSEEIKEKVRITNRKNLGVNYPGQSEEIKQKIRATVRERYNVEHPMQLEEVQETVRATNRKLYGADYMLQNDDIRTGIMNKYKEKTGYDNPFQNPESIKKSKETYKKRTGYENSLQNPEVREKRRKDYKQKTGYEYPSQNPEIKEKKKDTYKKRTGYEYPSQNPEIKKKMSETYKQRTGYDNPSQNPEVQEKIKQNYKDKTGYEHPSHNPVFWDKVMKTRETNGNRSKDEIEFEKLLKKNRLKSNKDFIEEYRDDERYPFFCDFYIPSKDLFIELNLFPTHNTHWYNKNSIKDAKILKEWKIKAKTSDFYKDMVQTWTIRDPKKRDYARKNNLNYVVLWTQKDIENWFKDGMPIRKDWK